MNNSHYSTNQSSSPSVNIVNGFYLLNNKPVPIKVHSFQVIGQGTFGSIEKANITVLEDDPIDNNERKFIGAIKKVHQDPRYKNRELNIIQKIRSHPNIVDFKYYYYSVVNNDENSKSSGNAATNGNMTGGSGRLRMNNTNFNSNLHHHQGSTTGMGSGTGDVYLHLVMECMPECLSDLIVRYHHQHQHHRHGNNNGSNSNYLPATHVRLYTLQMLRALGYLHSLGICHRDIKTSNLLVDESRLALKLCDFGSAKELVSGTNSVSYISSRYYRAPELLFGTQQYTTAIDVWSAGCVLGEMLRMGCLFTGADTIDQITKIVRVLGSPSPADLRAMNPPTSSTNQQQIVSPSILPHVLPCPVRLYFPHHTPADLLDLLSRMLVYDPSKRPHPICLLLHRAFDEIFLAQTTSTVNSSTSEKQRLAAAAVNKLMPAELAVLTAEERVYLYKRRNDSTS